MSRGRHLDILEEIQGFFKRGAGDWYTIYQYVPHKAVAEVSKIGNL